MIILNLKKSNSYSSRAHHFFYSALFKFFFILLFLFQNYVYSQNIFPSKPFRIYVGFVPGGFTDFAARIVSTSLAESFGNQVIVDNRPGANGHIAAELTAKSLPDGYTFYMASSGHTTNPILLPKNTLDPVRDFSAISLLADIPNLLVVHPSVPARNLIDFIKLARARPVYLSQATSGVGSPGHLIGELLKISAGIKFIHVPYKGSGAMMTDLLGGQVDFSFPTTAAALSYISSGRLRALGIASAKRSQAYPDIPTISEAGVPGFSVMGWYGLIGPARIPKDILSTLSLEIVKISKKTDVRAKLLNAGAEPVGNSSDDFLSFIAADYEKWNKVIKIANIKM